MSLIPYGIVKMQTADPTARAVVQCLHEVDPSWSWYCDIGHSVQFLEPSMMLNDPGGHG